MGLVRYMLAICVWAMVPFDARGGIRDLEGEAAARVAKRFIMLAGSEENALALALSLRNGGMVMLVLDDGGSSVPETSVFELPARTMEWDDVRICLALVEDSLVRRGVRRPTPYQLEATLMQVLESLEQGNKQDSRVRVRGTGS